MRVALVGAGVIGKHHAQVLDQLDGAELVVVVDPKTDKAAELAEPRGVRTAATLAEVLDDVDLVSVCTPTGLHGVVAIEALAAGKHVLIEKPAEITPERIDEIIAARDKAGTVVGVISQHRFDPSTEIVLDKIREGEFGRLTSGIASVDWFRSQGYYDSGDWRGTWELDGGGAVMNQGVHTVDLLVAALGRPVEVFAHAATLAHERIEVEDVLTASVRFDSGALGVLHATTAAYPGMSAHLHVHGDRGSAIIDNDHLTWLHATPADAAAAGSDYGSGKTGNQAEDYPEALGATGADGGDPTAALQSNAHLAQYRNMLGAIAGTEPLRVGLEENRQSVALICGAYESARTGRPVQLG